MKRKTNEEAIAELESIPFMFPDDGGLGPAYCMPDELPKITVDGVVRNC